MQTHPTQWMGLKALKRGLGVGEEKSNKSKRERKRERESLNNRTKKSPSTKVNGL